MFRSLLGVQFGVPGITQLLKEPIEFHCLGLGRDEREIDLLSKAKSLSKNYVNRMTMKITSLYREVHVWTLVISIKLSECVVVSFLIKTITLN